MKYTQIPVNTFQQLQMNAGYFAKNFDPAEGAVEQDDILGATSGGANITVTPSYVDLGEDIDNCPKNTKELKQIESWEIKGSGTLVTMNPEVARMFVGAADIDESDATKIVPRTTLSQSDFADLWLIGDYSDKNGAQNGGFIAIRLINALSTGGFQLQTTDKAKGQFAFEFTAHQSISTPDVVPVEIYVQAGTAEPEG